MRLLERQGTQLVDHADPVGDPLGERDEPAGRATTPVSQRPDHPDQNARWIGVDHARRRQHLQRGELFREQTGSLRQHRVCPYGSRSGNSNYRLHSQRAGPDESVLRNQCGVFGATSRIAVQSLLTAAVEVVDSPEIGAASAMSVASTELARPTLGVNNQMTPPPTRSVSESTSASTRSPSSLRHHSTTESTTLP